MDPRRIGTVLLQGVRLRCPRCGEAPLFSGLFAMHERCSACGLLFEREQGYFVGAIYVNYAFTVGITIVGFLLLDHFTNIGLTAQIVIWSVFGVVFPIVFFRYSRSLWLSVEYVFNPEPPVVRERR